METLSDGISFGVTKNVIFNLANMTLAGKWKHTDRADFKWGFGLLFGPVNIILSSNMS